MTRVSIGLPVYNGENYLEEAILSMLNQTFEDFELIISDNGSTDRTRDICKKYESKDPRIRYYRSRENLGASWNFNRVFALSKGDLFKWVSHDDVCAPTFVQRCVEVLDQKQDVVLCYPKAVIIDEKSKKVESYYDDFNFVDPSPCVRFRHFLYRKSTKCNPVFGVIRSHTLRRSPLIGNYNTSDVVLLAYLVLSGAFYEIPEELFFRRDHHQTSSRANPTRGELAGWFDPKKSGKIVFTYWRIFFEYIRCVLRADLNTFERIYCLGLLRRNIWFKRVYLKREIKSGIKEFIARL